jgi:hypothetical protein
LAIINLAFYVSLYYQEDKTLACGKKTTLMVDFFSIKLKEYITGMPKGK